jgi:hypothetical protein
MAINRSKLAAHLYPGINKFIGMGYKLRVNEEQFKAIYGMAKTSMKATEENVMMAGFAAAERMNEGGAKPLDEGLGERWRSRVTMILYGKRFEITKMAVDDNQYEKPTMTYSKWLGWSMAERKTLEAFAVLNNATSTSYLGGDGKALCVTDHPTQDGGTNSNLLAVAADFNEASLEEMVLQVADWVTERGTKISANIKRVILGRDFMFVAERLAKSVGRVGTNDNDINIHKGLPFVSEGFTVVDYTTDPDAWFGITDIPDGLVHYQRQAIETKTDVDFLTDNIRVAATARDGFGWDNPLGIIMSAGA